MTQVRNIPWDDYDIAIPAFLTIVVMPFTYSITNGIGAGFLSYAVIKLLLQAKADIESKGYDGRTPLLLAAAYGHEAVVKVLESTESFQSLPPSHPPPDDLTTYI